MATDKIQQMVNFIETEAREKANEIELQTNEEFAIEKQNLVEDAKKKIRSDYENKEKNVEVHKQVEQSNKKKEASLQVLRMKEDILHELLKDSRTKLKALSNDKNKYKPLLRDLVLQGLYTLHEKKVSVYVREKDVSLMESLIQEVEKEYKENTKGRACKVTLSNKYHLPADGSGGALITALKDRIKVDNSLDQRLNLCHDNLIPISRQMLFGVEEEIVESEDKAQ